MSCIQNKLSISGTKFFYLPSPRSVHQSVKNGAPGRQKPVAREVPIVGNHWLILHPLSQTRNAQLPLSVQISCLVKPWSAQYAYTYSFSPAVPHSFLLVLLLHCLQCSSTPHHRCLPHSEWWESAHFHVCCIECQRVWKYINILFKIEPEVVQWKQWKTSWV